MTNSDQWLHGTKMFRIISKGRLRKLSVHQRNRICIICGLSRCSGCSDRCGWSLLYSKWQVGGKIYSTTNYVKNRYGQKLSAYFQDATLNHPDLQHVYYFITSLSSIVVLNRSANMTKLSTVGMLFPFIHLYTGYGDANPRYSATSFTVMCLSVVIFFMLLPVFSTSILGILLPPLKNRLFSKTEDRRLKNT